MSLLFSIGFLKFGFIDAIDILLVAFIIYQLYKLIRGSVAETIFYGLLFIYLLFLLVKALEMPLMTGLLGQFIGVGVLAAIIVFREEIRRFLLFIGRSTVRNNEMIQRFFKQKGSVISNKTKVSEIVEACKEMVLTQTGCLLVITKRKDLKMSIESGDKIDGIVSKRLLLAIFNKYSPLHDGAAFIHEGRIIAARCIMPVSDKDLPAQYGLRHRAAVGVSEISDALVIVVSEETGKMSIISKGSIQETDSKELRKTINHFLTFTEEIEQKDN